MKKKSFYLVSLGCAKNTVDSESMGQLLVQDGFGATLDPQEAEVLIVNTCGFIGPAKDESYQALEELAAAKQPGQLLVASGCLTQRYGAEVVERVPGIDGVIGTRRWMDILDLSTAYSGVHTLSRSTICRMRQSPLGKMRGMCCAFRWKDPAHILR